MEKLIRQLLEAIGEDPERSGLEKTPARVAKMYDELMAGYGEDAVETLRTATFPAETQGMVVCRDIDFVSMCEHHMLPFFGTATIAYLPGERLVGISKLVRVTQAFARRLQVQERMGQQILDSMTAALAPRGVLVHIQATHLCMVARGVKQPNAVMETRHVSGPFDVHPELVASVLAGRA